MVNILLNDCLVWFVTYCIISNTSHTLILYCIINYCMADKFYNSHCSLVIESIMYCQICIKRSATFELKKMWPYKTGDFLKEVQFIWKFLWQDKKKVTFLYRWLLNRGDYMGRFDCILYEWLAYKVHDKDYIKYD